ncbi:methionyl-tRNA formyltransferase [Patescibacteria group bacterium]
MKIIFFGTPTFAVPFLSKLVHDSEIEVTAVVCQSDKPVGRKQILTPPPVKSFALDHNLQVLQPKTLKDESAAQSLTNLEADLFVVVAYGKIIPKNILDLTPLGCINVHPSLLPKYRGPSPMQYAILNGDSQTAISIMLLDEGMDTGPVLATEMIGLDDNETYESLSKKVELQGPKLLIQTLKRYQAGEITPLEQDDSKASITKLLKREDGHIDWSKDMKSIDQQVRAFYPWPGTWSLWNRNNSELRLKIIELKPVDFKNDLPPGTVKVDEDRLLIDCADGTLEITQIQPEGKPVMSAKDFIRGYQDVDETILA